MIGLWETGTEEDIRQFEQHPSRRAYFERTGRPAGLRHDPLDWPTDTGRCARPAAAQAGMRSLREAVLGEAVARDSSEAAPPFGG